MKFNLTLVDGTYLNNIILSTSNQDYSIGELKTEEEFFNYLNSNGNQRMYFCGSYVQGGLSHPKIIKSHEIIKDGESYCTLICTCGKIYNHISWKCDRCGNVFVD